MADMTINDFIEELKQKEIEITFSEGKLKYKGPEEYITPELIEQLRNFKGKLIKYFWPSECGNLMPINPSGSRTPLFIIHGDNGNYIISEHFGPDQPVFGFFHPGSEGEEIGFKSVNYMARVYLERLRLVYPEGPVYLIGFSFGGLLAYEMAVQLQLSGRNVPFLVIIDSICPSAHEAVKWHKSIYKIVRKNILGPLRRKIERGIKSLICESYIFFKKPIPIERRNFYMVNKYLTLGKRYRPTVFNGNILLFRTTENPSSYKYIGWETLVSEIKMFEIEGRHLEIFIGKTRVDILCKEIENHLNHVVV